MVSAFLKSVPVTVLCSLWVKVRGAILELRIPLSLIGKLGSWSGRGQIAAEQP